MMISTLTTMTFIPPTITTIHVTIHVITTTILIVPMNRSTNFTSTTVKLPSTTIAKMINMMKQTNQQVRMRMKLQMAIMEKMTMTVMESMTMITVTTDIILMMPNLLNN